MSFSLDRNDRDSFQSNDFIAKSGVKRKKCADQFRVQSAVHVAIDIFNKNS